MKDVNRAQAKPESRYLTRAESAEYLTSLGYPTSPKTLAKLACIGGRPRYRKFGIRALYAPDDLVEWAESKTSRPVRNTSEYRATKTEDE